jgi:hypothetical protein
MAHWISWVSCLSLHRGQPTTHVVCIWNKGYKATFTRLRAALLHALFSGTGE